MSRSFPLEDLGLYYVAFLPQLLVSVYLTIFWGVTFCYPLAATSKNTALQRYAQKELVRLFQN